MQCWCPLGCLCSTSPQLRFDAQEVRRAAAPRNCLLLWHLKCPGEPQRSEGKNCIFQDGVSAHTYLHHQPSYRSTMVYPVYSSISFSLQTRRFRSPTLRLSKNRLLLSVVQLWIPSGWRSGCPPPDVSHHQVLPVLSFRRNSHRDQTLGTFAA